jgi:hypothetical protein
VIWVPFGCVLERIILESLEIPVGVMVEEAGLMVETVLLPYVSVLVVELWVKSEALLEAVPWFLNAVM